MKRCKCDPTYPCRYITNGGYCAMPDEMACLAQEIGTYITPLSCNGETLNVKSLKPNSIEINCDEITLTKDSVGIEVNIQNLIQNIDKFETIEINGRVFKRVREE